MEIEGREIGISNIGVYIIIMSIVWVKKMERKIRVRKGRWEWIGEEYYRVIGRIVKENVGEERYVRMIYVIGGIIIMGNMSGMVPYSYTVTSQIGVSMSMSMIVFIGVNIIGVRERGSEMSSIWWPRGVGYKMSIMIVGIEMISYMMKVVTLGVRLTANMLSGHTLLVIISSMIGKIYKMGGMVSMMGVMGGMVMLMVLIVLELVIGVLQGYVFVLLSSIYIRDVSESH
uniref:ATP synthase subunit a n=1 Tax=Galdieria sulphuraria TaxID=130081 RepID=A0A075W0A6_GALSU|nr:ATP synthase F0 subunit 6 [Galdieria sulphuraria]AIG92646.1 ATP synthase F0 subunit 6 [Galdieria sulphuraria]